METVFVLFQTDTHRSRRSRVFCGVFPSEWEAVAAAKENDLYTCDSEVEIVECEIGKFEEQ